MNRSTLFCTTIAAAVALVAAAPTARASFPGGNGLLAFQMESVAGDHTQDDVWTIRPDGSGPVQLTATPDQNEFGPAWNPAGTRIAFWRTKAPFGPGSLWVMKADGTGARRLTKGIDARDPAWSPDGTRLVYTDADQGMHLWSLRASDGQDRVQLTTGAGFDFEPAWSPDGTRIAFTRGDETGDPGNLEVLDVASGHITQVTTSAAYDHQVGWAPDGSRLVFERDFDASSSIYTINPDGSGILRVTHGSYFDTGPAFSPDGTQIAFGSDRSGTFLADLWVMRSDGSHRHLVHDFADSAGFPDWQPVD